MSESASAVISLSNDNQEYYILYNILAITNKLSDAINLCIFQFPNALREQFVMLSFVTSLVIIFYHFLKLIICYISSGATNIAEVSSGFHQADWSNTFVIVYCYLISFLFCFICLLFYLFLARNLIVRICRRQVNLNLRYI